MKYIKQVSDDGKIHFDFASNDVRLGFAYREVDGYYVFVFEQPNHGAWSSYVLREIADSLDELNKEWDDVINNDPRITQPIQ